jgi:hypothetical protein
MPLEGCPRQFQDHRLRRDRQCTRSEPSQWKLRNFQATLIGEDLSICVGPRGARKIVMHLITGTASGIHHLGPRPPMYTPRHPKLEVEPPVDPSS